MTDEPNNEPRGRKPLPDSQKRKRRVIYVTDAEWEAFLRPAMEAIEKRRHEAPA